MVVPSVSSKSLSRTFVFLPSAVCATASEPFFVKSRANIRAQWYRAAKATQDQSSAGNSPAQRCCQRCSPVGRSSGRPSPQCLQEQEHTQPSVSTGSTNALQCLRKAKRSRAAADGALAVSRSPPSLSGLVLNRSRPPQIACVLTRFLEHRSRPDDCQLVNRLSRRADMRSSSRNPHGKHTRKTHVKSDT